MEIKKIKLYTFEELNDETKEKVLQRYRDNNDYFFLEEFIKEELNFLLEKHNIKADADNLELRYSLSFSQGDGVSFVGDFEYKGHNFYSRLGHLSNYYCHSNTTDITTDDDDENEDISQEIKELLLNEFEELYQTLCGDLEKFGYDVMESEDSEENIKERLEENEIYFRENGQEESLDK